MDNFPSLCDTVIKKIHGDGQQVLHWDHIVNSSPWTLLGEPWWVGQTWSTCFRLDRPSKLLFKRGGLFREKRPSSNCGNPIDSLEYQRWLLFFFFFF